MTRIFSPRPSAGQPDVLRGAAVLTPHAGEFLRAFGRLSIDRVRAPSVRPRRARAWLWLQLLKGADTIIARPDGLVAINASAPPWLATAGAGDVLAGLIAGLLAQGMGAWEASRRRLAARSRGNRSWAWFDRRRSGTGVAAGI